MAKTPVIASEKAPVNGTRIWSGGWAMTAGLPVSSPIGIESAASPGLSA
jgi:hypothetical protein